MKTNTLLFKATCLLMLLLSQVHCAKSSDSPPSVTGPTYTLTNGNCYASGTQVANSLCAVNGYYMTNNICYSTTTGTSVNTTYCSLSTGFYLNNGVCYVAGTNTVATSPTLCTTATTTATSIQCLGLYYYQSPQGFQPMYCNGTNCRGLTMYSQNGLQTNCL